MACGAGEECARGLVGYGGLFAAVGRVEQVRVGEIGIRAHERVCGLERGFGLESAFGLTSGYGC